MHLSSSTDDQLKMESSKMSSLETNTISELKSPSSSSKVMC